MAAASCRWVAVAEWYPARRSTQWAFIRHSHLPRRISPTGGNGGCCHLGSVAAWTATKSRSLTKAVCPGRLGDHPLVDRDSTCHRHHRCMARRGPVRPVGRWARRSAGSTPGGRCSRDWPRSTQPAGGRPPRRSSPGAGRPRRCPRRRRPGSTVCTVHTPRCRYIGCVPGRRAGSHRRFLSCVLAPSGPANGQEASRAVEMRRRRLLMPIDRPQIPGPLSDSQRMDPAARRILDRDPRR